MIPLSITIFYPKIASVLSYVGAVSSQFVIYILPTVTYLVKLKNDSDNPILYEANKLND